MFNDHHLDRCPTGRFAVSRIIRLSEEIISAKNGSISPRQQQVFFMKRLQDGTDQVQTSTKRFAAEHNSIFKGLASIILQQSEL